MVKIRITSKLPGITRIKPQFILIIAVGILNNTVKEFYSSDKLAKLKIIKGNQFFFSCTNSIPCT